MQIQLTLPDTMDPSERHAFIGALNYLLKLFFHAKGSTYVVYKSGHGAPRQTNPLPLTNPTSPV